MLRDAPPVRFLLGRLDRAVLPVSAVAIVVALGFGLVVPVLPVYARSFGVAAWQVGMVLTAFSVMRLVAAMPSGWLVGRMGAAYTVALGCAIVAVSSAAAGLAPTFEWLVGLRGIGGLGSAMFSTGLGAYLLATSLIAKFSLSTISFGVPAGAITPSQIVAP